MPAASKQVPERSTEEVADHELDALAIVRANFVEGCNAGLVLEHLVEDGLVLEAAVAGIGFEIAELDGDEFVCFEIGS